MKRIALFGSTGSIGTQTADIIEKYPEKFKLTSCFAYKNSDLIKEQIEKFNPVFAGLYNKAANSKLKNSYSGKTNIIDPESGLDEVLELADTVVVSISGFAGIGVTLEALKKGKQVAIATKEVLVSAGDIVNEYTALYGGSIIPIDSEHSAVWQCLEGINKGGDYREHVRRIILTASGGPFRTRDRDTLKDVTVQEALKHPNWSMGAKITIDSATMMNKGLEVIEAERLYKVGADRIDILVHPQSIVHSMVECVDGNILAQLGNANMRHPILYALSYPERIETRFGRLDLTKASALTFEEPDTEKFPSIKLAYKALEFGGTAPCVMNAANEKAVALFLEEKIRFTDIPVFVEERMERLSDNGKKLTLESIIEADRIARS